MASTITFSGLGSGLDTASWVTALVDAKKTETVTPISDKISAIENKQTGLSTVKSKYTALQTALQTMTDSLFGTAADVFAKNSVKSSNEDIVTATVTPYASRQNFSINVEQLATYTTAESDPTKQVAGLVNEDTKVSSLANGSAKTGNMSVYVDNQKYNIDIAEDATVGDVLKSIKDKTGLNATVADGKISISSNSNQSISIGTASDTSNFASITSLKKNDDGSYSSYNKVSTVNTTAKLTSEDAGFAEAIQKGSFKIGGATFTIDDNTTLQTLINKINSSTSAGANAYWDSAAGKMVLTSKTEGSFNINIENIEGNFTDVMGLTESTYNEDGSVKSSKLADGTQSLGDVAKLTINGTEVISSSNTVTSDISGVVGLTLNLKAESKDSSNTTISVNQDTDKVYDAVNNFVTAFNDAISATDTATAAEDGSLNGETSLYGLRNSIRTQATASSDSTSDVYKTLADIGITTGAVGSSVDADTDKLVIDKEKFLSALNSNPDEVKKLLVGTSSGEGVFGTMKKTVDQSVSAYGYFTQTNKSFTSQVDSLNTSLTRAQDSLTSYQARLESQFSAMELLITSMNNAYNTMSSNLASLS